MNEPRAGEGEVGVPAPGYRLPDATWLGPVRLQVADLERSRNYYSEVLGLRPLEEEQGLLPLADLTGTVLLELREEPGAAPVPRHGRLGLYHVALLLPDRGSLGAFIAHLGRRGVRAGMSDHDVSEAVYLTDPDGLGIEVYADRPRSMWRRHGRELHMTTEPLDVQSVLASALAPWSGMPGGTAIGHVHLFVQELERAADFYHRGLGLDRVVWSYPGALFLSAGGYHHHLGVNTWAADAAPAGPRDARLLEWRVALPDHASVDAAADSVEAAGFALDREGKEWSAADPWGTVVRVYAGEGSE